MEISLRPYQQEFIDNVRAEFKHGHRRVVGVAPCGAGKTIMTGWMIREVIKNGKRAIFFVHRQELIEQTSQTFCRLNIPHGVINSGIKMNLILPVQIASVQTLVRRLDKIPAPDFLICDECHHILANSYKDIIDKWNKAYLLGVTATPERIGGVRLGDVFSSMVEAPSVSELIQLGNLTQFRYYAPDGVNLDDIRTRFGEYLNSDLSRLMNKREIVGNLVTNYKIHADGKSAVCYCVNVEHSKNTAEAFNAAGIPAAHCDGETPAAERFKIVNDFRRGNIKVLCNAELFGEGFDVPNMDAVILARPTKSLTLFIQQSMRPMRPDPNNPDKVAIIIDAVRNCTRFGLPDSPRYWSLEPNDKQSKPPVILTCPHCGCIVEVTERTTTKDRGNIIVTSCPNCGRDIPVRAKEIGEYHPRNIIQVDGNLTQINTNSETSQIITNKVKHSLNSIEDFLEIEKARGYKRGWAVFKALELVKSYKDCLHIAEVMGYKQGWAYYKWQDISKFGLEKNS